MDFIALDTIQSGTSDPPSGTQAINPINDDNSLPNYPQQSQIKPKSKGGGRLKLALIMGGCLAFGVALANVGGLKPYVIGSGDNPSQPQPIESPSPDSQVTPSPEETPLFSEGDDPNIQLRDTYIQQAINEAETQRKLMDESAADGVLADARKENKARGTNYQIYVMRRLNAALKEAKNLVASGVDLTSPEGLRRGWILSGQIRGLLLAWQRVNTQDATLLTDGVVTPKFSITADISAVLAQIEPAKEYATAAISASYQQVLRNQKTIADNKAKEQLKLLQEQKVKAQQAKEDKGGAKNAK